MRDELLLEVLHDTATAVRVALDALDDWGSARTRPGQYLSDLAADEAALAVLAKAGLGVMSEESGVHDVERDPVVVIDPVDGRDRKSVVYGQGVSVGLGLGGRGSIEKKKRAR